VHLRQFGEYAFQRPEICAVQTIEFGRRLVELVEQIPSRAVPLSRQDDEFHAPVGQQRLP
jgi:hypothetical protein